MNSSITRRAISVSIASSGGSSKRGSAGWDIVVSVIDAAVSSPTTALGLGSASPRLRDDRVLLEADREMDRLAGCHVQPGLGELVGRRVRRQAGPLRDDPRQLPDLELRALVAQKRQ